MFENFDREYLKNVILRVLGAVLGIAVLIYIGYQIWQKATSSFKCETAVPFTVSQKMSGNGYIFRCERIVDGVSGSVVPSVQTGERVALYAEVAKIYSAHNDEAMASLGEINERISLLSSIAYSGELSTKDVSKLDSEVYEVMTDIGRSVASGRYSEAVARRINLLTKINKRSLAAGNGAEQKAELEALQAEKARITSSLGSVLSAIYAPSAGWYYPEVDGYETVFDASAIDFLTYGKFCEMIQAEPASTAGSAGKIVTDNRWYFVCEMSERELKRKTEGNTYTLFFPQNKGQRLDMTLHSLSFGTDGRGIAVFYSDEMPSGFDYTRVQSYELLEDEYTGFRVPKSAVRVIDAQMGVYVLSGETVKFRKIDVIGEYENSYIVKMDHNEPAETEPAETNEIGEPVTDTSAPESTSAEEESSGEEEKYKWLGLNESIIVGGKGMRDGRIITTVK